MPKHRGIALIINNYEFPDSYSFAGKGHDGLLLAKQFKRLDYKVILKRNLKKEKMLRELKKVRKQVSADHDSLIVVIGSHGDEVDDSREKSGKKHIIFGQDINKYGYIELKRDVIDFFNNENCPKLSNAVKLFIIDCCRGWQEHRGFDMTRIGVNNRYIKAKPIAGNAGEAPIEKKMQRYTKTVVVNAVKSGYSSKNIENGSILMLAFEKCLQQYSHSYTLDEINELLNFVAQQSSFSAIDVKFYQAIQVKKLAKYGNFRFEKMGSYHEETDELDDDLESESDAESESVSVDSKSGSESDWSLTSRSDSSYSDYSSSDSDRLPDRGRDRSSDVAVAPEDCLQSVTVHLPMEESVHPIVVHSGPSDRQRMEAFIYRNYKVIAAVIVVVILLFVISR